MKEIFNTLEENPEKINESNNQELKDQLLNQLALLRLFNATGIKTGIGKIINIELSKKQLSNLNKIKFIS